MNSQNAPAFDAQDQEWFALLTAHRQNRVLQAELWGIEDKDGEPCLTVWFGMVKGFIPFSETGMRDQEEMFFLLGSKFQVAVTDLDRGTMTVSLSITKAKELRGAETRQHLKEGEVRAGIVQRISRGRVIVDLDGVEAVLPKEELSWAYVYHPKEAVRLGQEIRVRIAELREDGTVIVSKKALERDPWDAVAQQLKIGQPCLAEVTGANEKGVFLKLQAGVAAMAPHSGKMGALPEKGKRVVVVVQSIKEENKRINCRIVRVVD